MQLNFYFAQYGLLQSKLCTMIDVQTNSIEASFGRKPGTNTVAYYPLTSVSTSNDMSGNNNNLTNSGATFGTYQGVDSMNGNGHSIYGQITNLPVGNQTRTISLRCYWVSGNSRMSVFGYGQNATNKRVNLGKTTGNQMFIDFYSNSISISQSFPQGKRINIGFTHNGTTCKIYYNSQLLGSKNTSLDTAVSDFVISGRGTNHETFNGYISEFIIENKERTQTDRTKYFEKLKSKYGY